MTTLVATQEIEPTRLQSELFVAAVEDYVREQAMPHEACPVPVDERRLTEVDHINRHRLPDGSHSPWADQEVLKNLTPAVKEAAMPFAVSTTYQEFRPSQERDTFGRQAGTYMWLGMTALQVAETGYRFHSHEAARARVAVEVDEARDVEANLRPGYAKVFISPRMSPADATRSVAKSEHLADDDAVRMTWPDTDAEGRIKGKHLQSLLIREVPLSAWVSMLKDPGNIFGRSVTVENENSALAVMKTHSQLEIPLEKLPEGVISLVDAVIPYITDEDIRKKVEVQAELFRADQEDLHQKAESIAERWQRFEGSLADSLHTGFATKDIKGFIYGLQNEWNEGFLRMLKDQTTADGRIRMTRQLAAKIEEARQNTLWTTAAVITGNEQVLKQLSPEVARRIEINERLIQTMRHEGYDAQDMARMEAENNRIIAQQNVKVGAGCPGETEAAFKKAQAESAWDNPETSNPKEEGVGEISYDFCIIPGCPYESKVTKVGGCKICLTFCQPQYDKGLDPAEEYAKAQAKAKYN